MTKTNTRNRHDSDRTRQELLDAALDLIVLQGYAGTPLSQICRAAGVTKGAFYWHFTSKAHMLIEVFDTMLEPLWDASDKIMGGELPPPEKLEKLLETILAVTMADDGVRTAMTIIFHKTEFTKELVEVVGQGHEEMNRFISGVAPVVAKGQEQGLMRPDVDPQLFAWSMFAHVGGVFRAWLMDPDFPLAEKAPELARIFMLSLAPEAGPSR